MTKALINEINDDYGLVCEPIIRTERYGFDNLHNDKERFGFPEDLVRSYAFIPIPTVFTSHFRFIMSK